MALSKKKYKEMLAFFYQRPAECKPLPKSITKTIRVLVQFNSWNFKVYRLKPSGKAEVLELDLFTGEIPNIMDFPKSKFSRSDAVTHASYEETTSYLKELIKTQLGVGIIQIKREAK